MYESQGLDYYLAKFSPLQPRYLSVLTDSDLQVLEHDSDQYNLLYVNRLGSKYDSIRCIEWSKDPSNPLMIAAGFSNGRISLISYTSENGYYDDKNVSGSVIKEFVFKGTRGSRKKCNALAWSSSNPSLLAAGYDWIERKNTGQHSIAIWDVNKEAKTHEIKYPIYAPYVADSKMKKDYFAAEFNHEKGVSKKNKIQIIKDSKHILNKKDDSTALLWLNGESSKLITGTQKGALKLLDLQGSSPTEINAHKKHVNSIKQSPFNSNIIASCCEDQVKIFDLRKTKHALFQINHDIKDFEFSNYHSYVLATIHNKKDFNVVKFWNINIANTEASVAEWSTVDLKYPFTQQKCKHNISYITWWPVDTEIEKQNNKYLVVSDGGNMMHNHVYKVIDTMPVTFSAANELAFTDQNKIFFYDFMSQNVAKINEWVDKHKEGAVLNNDAYEPDSNLDDISDLIVSSILPQFQKLIHL
jgi:hypothetical protein